MEIENLNFRGTEKTVPVVVIDGHSYCNLSQESVAEVASTEAEAVRAWNAALAQEANTIKVDLFRRKIKKDVGDSDSLLGTTADAAQLAVVGLLIDLKALGSSTTFANYKSKKIELLIKYIGGGPSSESGINPLQAATNILDKIELGEIKLTAVEKGVAVSLDEIMGRATQITAILSADTLNTAGEILPDLAPNLSQSAQTVS